MLRQSLTRSLRRTANFKNARTFSGTPHRGAAQDVEITIDGTKVSVPAGSALIQACEKIGVTIPRMCLVEVERSPKPVASCAWPVTPGMVVKTNTPMVHKAREGIMEFLLANHPLDCPICDQGGECDLQDQSMRYGADRGRFHEIGGKRGVEDKNIGPLVKFGSTGRGNDIQIGTYLERNLNTELSGNVIDLCPVGALTSRPYAFRARPWELKNTETIDVHNGMGSAIRVDTRGLEVMRVLPRLNEDINIEWIDDKTRFACDGLKTQRLTTPLIKRENKFYPATWEQALAEIASAYEKIQPTGEEMKAIAGHLTDAESMVALKDLFNSLGSEQLSVDQPQGHLPPAHGVDIRSNYLFNSSIHGIDEADAILLVGTNTRLEAAVLNARIRKRWLYSDLEIGLIGENFDSTFEYEHLGDNAVQLRKALTGPFEHLDAKAIYETIGSFVDKNAATFITPEWNGYNILQRTAARGAAYDIGFVPHSTSQSTSITKFVYLLGAQYADVILPGAAFTEKNATYVNTEGRTQITRAATSLPGAAREDWKIVRAVSEFLRKPLNYDDLPTLRSRMSEISPTLVTYDVLEKPSQGIAGLGVKTSLVEKNRGSKALGDPIKRVIHDFYFTDVISRSSPTMARCSAAKLAPGSESEVQAVFA
ncbi:hypothetical protein Dda_8481 [Drechslerella dactyloides]|uniref:NADH-ubiquinone oxidoreductase 78 kDa subunit, mitochondrial n=1 Tax=Drechslerella dactyloides TaxID=74499 RepID=A0AAD6NEV3_DREDA|nr:hypothetical protein Dda_8481 [Drechslerella dactyloides]